MTTIVEESRAREEEERQAVERRRASLHEKNEMNINRSVADDNAIQMMKKLIQAAMEHPEPLADHPRETDSPSGKAEDGKSRTPAEKSRTTQLPSSTHRVSSSGLQHQSLVSSTASLAASESTEATSRKDVSTGRRKQRRSSAMSADHHAADGTGRHATGASMSWKLNRQLKAIVSNVYSHGQFDKVVD